VGRVDDVGIACMLMRAGTSKGVFFIGDDLPEDEAERDELLLRLMGTPDPRQIDGLGGAHPLTSKVAVVTPSPIDGVDVDYLFLQLGVEQRIVTDRQTCGNLLAGVGAGALARGRVAR
jgi:4-oxalomesaconate tautomerase